MTPTELQLLKKKHAENEAKIYQAENLLETLDQLKLLQKQISLGKEFSLLIDDRSFCLNQLGINSESFKKIINDIIDKQYMTYMQQWENLK